MLCEYFGRREQTMGTIGVKEANESFCVGTGVDVCRRR